MQKGSVSGLQIAQGIRNKKAEMRRCADSILAQDWAAGWQDEQVIPVWTARCHCNGQDAYYRINDPFRSQMLTQDALEAFVHGRIAHRYSDLNPTVTEFKPQCVEVHEQTPPEEIAIAKDESTSKKSTQSCEQEVTKMQQQEAIKKNNSTPKENKWIAPKNPMRLNQQHVKSINGKLGSSNRCEALEELNEKSTEKESNARLKETKHKEEHTKQDTTKSHNAKDVSADDLDREIKKYAGEEEKEGPKKSKENNRKMGSKEKKKEEEIAATIKVKDVVSEDESFEEDDEDDSENDSMGLNKEERMICDSIHIDEESSEDSVSHGSLPEEDSAKNTNMLVLHEKIARLQHQNQVNIQRLCELDCKDEEKSKIIVEKDKSIRQCRQEIEDLKKELAVKKKFVFKM